MGMGDVPCHAKSGLGQPRIEAPINSQRADRYQMDCRQCEVDPGKNNQQIKIVIIMTLNNDM